MLVDALSKLVAGQNLSRDEAASLMRELMSGAATDAQIGSLLTALRIKGETVDEITGFANEMRAHSVKVETQSAPLLDTCGTGGGSFRVFNVSTAAGFVAAAAGIPVAKHGNRAASGVCGSADVLEALGVRVDITADQCARCIDEVGIGFLFARTHHPAVKHVSTARRDIGIRTVFNLLGPLTNPAGAKLQVMGVYDSNLCPLAAGALRELGSERALVVHSEPGLDELSTFSANRICELRLGEITDTVLLPKELGCQGEEPDQEDLKPAVTLEGNAAMLRESIGAGPETSGSLARRNLVALNAAAALRVAGKFEEWKDAFCSARAIITSGLALNTLERLAALTNSFQ